MPRRIRREVKSKWPYGGAKKKAGRENLKRRRVRNVHTAVQTHDTSGIDY